MISKAIFNRLSTDAGVAAIVSTKDANGNTIAVRVYPEDAHAFEKTLPLAVYKIESATAIMAHDGPCGLNEGVVVIAAEAITYDGAATLGQAIDASLGNAKGTWAGIVVQGCFREDDGQSDDVFTLPVSEDLTIYVQQLTYRIFWEG